MSYRETRSEVAAAARWRNGQNPTRITPSDLKFRWSMHRDDQSTKRDWYGFINLDRRQTELLIDWLKRRLAAPDLTNTEGEVTLMLSGWNNVGKNGQAYVGGIGAPSLSNEALPSKGKRFH